MSFADTAVLFVLALLLFGPKKLPQIARQVGKALAEFRRASNEFKAQIEAEISQLEFEEKRKEQEQQQQNALPKPEPVVEAVQSSRYSLNENVTEPVPPSPAPEIDPSAHTSHA
jgi:sec-independent protein translocase protein TatB